MQFLVIGILKDRLMIDFHTHILPGIDDGSRDIEMTAAMLEEEKRQGVDLICATPHFYAHRMSFDDFLDGRKESAERTAELLSERPDLPRILTGAEVYYFQGMGQAERIKELCVTGTDTILVEMPFAQWKSDVYRDIFDLVQRRDLNVVIAHIERYNEFQKDRSVWNDVFDLAVTRQINAGTFLKGWNRPRFAIKIMKNHPENTLVGTDCHNMDQRRPNLSEARESIKKKLGQDVLVKSDRKLRKLLDGAVDITGRTWTEEQK